MKRNENRLAEKYAQAVFPLLKDSLDSAEFERLIALADQLDAQRSIILFSQVIRQEPGGGSVLEQFFQHAGYQDHFSSLISLLILQRRMILLPQILRILYRRYLDDRGIIPFVFESPVTLTEAEQSKLVLFLQKKTGKEIRYTLKKNPALIAGIKLYSDTLGYEHSIRQKLYQL